MDMLQRGERLIDDRSYKLVMERMLKYTGERYWKKRQMEVMFE
jgi:hypothetical protein